MISEHCLVEEFINMVKEKEADSLILMAAQEATEAERMSLRRSSDYSEVAKQRGKQYAEILKSLILFVRHNIRPSGISDEEFKLFSSVKL